MRPLYDCDYVQDVEGAFWIVHGYHQQDPILANKLFVPSESGRWHPTERRHYAKVIDQNLKAKQVPRSTIFREFFPREKTAEVRRKLRDGVWKRLLDELCDMVGEENVGVMGSVLLGFPPSKDLDIIVYGLERCAQLRQKINALRSAVGATQITQEHIAYQIRTHMAPFSTQNSFGKLLANKWSALQFGKVCSTIRFAYEEDEIPENPWLTPLVREVELEGVVEDELHSDFCPRSCTLNTPDGNYHIATLFWAYQSFARAGQRIRVHGNVHADGRTITLDEFCHFIEVI